MKFGWSLALAAGGTALGLVLLCIAPFAAVATLAARTLERRTAYAALGAMWLANQVIGFAFLHYPQTPATYALGFGFLVAALVAAETARALRRVPLPLAFLAAFAAYELAMYAFALRFGGAAGFSVPIVALVLEGNALGLAILWTLRRAFDVATSRTIGQPLPK